MTDDGTTAPAGEDTGAVAGEETTEEQTTETKETIETETETAADDWRSPIKDEKARAFADRYATPGDAAVSAFEMRQKLSNAITLPGKKASEEEVAEYHKKIGVPDKAEGYEIKLPENLPEGLEMDDAADARQLEFKQAMHAAGATPAVVQAAHDIFYKMGLESVDAQEKATKAATDEAMAGLEKEWGPDAKANHEYAGRAAKAFGGADFEEFIGSKEIDGVLVCNHPAFKKIFAKIGRGMGEGSVDLTMNSTEKASAEERRDELTVLIREARDSGDTKTAQRLDTERNKLTVQLYGDEPIA